MKKLVLVLVAMFPLFCFSQNIIVANGNNSNTSNNQDQEECPYRINGICSTEDIGGVEFEFIFENNYNYLRLTNYNNTTVSVLFDLDYDDVRHFGCYYYTEWEDVVIYISRGVKNYVLKSNEEKKIKLCRTTDCDGKPQDESSEFKIIGSIVRKLQ